MSAFDAVAPQFDRHRALPEVAAQAVRTAVLAALPPRPRLLDLGAGTGRIGWPFVASSDAYIGIDLSLSMLREFKQRQRTAALAQADGSALPFRDRIFDGVLLVQIFGGLRNWRAVIDESLRVLRPGGAVMIGRTQTPDDGVDARMKRQLDLILSANAILAEQNNTRAQAEQRLEELAVTADQIDAAHWPATRSPRDFLDRHGGGARFGKVPETLRASALSQLTAWALKTFGSLDTGFAETHRFSLRRFTFAER